MAEAVFENLVSINRDSNEEVKDKSDKGNINHIHRIMFISATKKGTRGGLGPP